MAGKSSAKLIGIILLAAGIGLCAWGYSISSSVQGKVARALTGSASNKAMYLYVGGGACVAAGLFQLVRK